jgi:hypothetical protein
MLQYGHVNLADLGPMQYTPFAVVVDAVADADEVVADAAIAGPSLPATASEYDGGIPVSIVVVAISFCEASAFFILYIVFNQLTKKKVNMNDRKL